MADERKIVIEIVSSSVGSEGSDPTRISTPESKGSSSSSLLETTGGINEEASRIQFAKAAGSSVAIAGIAAKVVLDQTLQQINMYFVLTEDYKSQRTISNLNATMNGIGSVAAYTAGGVAAGAAGGPVGMLIGGAIGLASGIAKEGFGGLNKQFEQNLDISTKGYSVEYNRNLAGLLIGENRNTEN